MASPEYRHTQTSPLRFVLIVIILISLWASWVWRAEFWAWFAMVCVAGVSAFVMLTMTSLTIEDKTDALSAQFGPVPLFSTRIRYDDIREFQATRSRVVDGWGIHYVPGRGWTWNLWGLDCVVIEREGNTIRIGSDDAANLAAFLKTRTAAKG